MAEGGSESAAGRPGPLTRALARICAGCPLCRARRRRPDSFLGRFVALYERFCPACRAYRRVRRMEGDRPA
ncbi:MAG: hypothetical protein JXP34_00070 [Planctomycetes bacterium]|nr:hypothetical protein [Planctomycetota bacterium]